MSDDLIEYVTESDYSFADILRCIGVPNIDDACKLANNTSCATSVKKLLRCAKMSPEMLKYALKNDMDIPSCLIFRKMRWLRKCCDGKVAKTCRLDENAADNNSMKVSCSCNHCQLKPGANAKFCDNKNCMACFLVSLASVKDSYSFLGAQDNKGNEITDPLLIRRSSHISCEFSCAYCDHVYDTTLNHFTNSGRRCPFCGHQKLCDDDSCETCHKNSFASNPDSKMFDIKRNKTTPRQVFPNSHKKYWFICDHYSSHEFEMAPSEFTFGQRCPMCRHKTEKMVHQHLINHFGENDIKRQYPIKECVGETGRNLPFDFYIKSLQLVIEIDGNHHFKNGVYHKDTICRRDEDIWKTTRLLATGRNLVRIYQPDLLAGRLKVVKCIKAYQKEASRVCYFADDMSIYDEHREALDVALAAEEE